MWGWGGGSGMDSSILEMSVGPPGGVTLNQTVLACKKMLLLVKSRTHRVGWGAAKGLGSLLHGAGTCLHILRSGCSGMLIAVSGRLRVRWLHGKSPARQGSPPLPVTPVYSANGAEGPGQRTQGGGSDQLCPVLDLSTGHRKPGPVCSVSPRAHSTQSSNRSRSMGSDPLWPGLGMAHPAGQGHLSWG